MTSCHSDSQSKPDALSTPADTGPKIGMDSPAVAGFPVSQFYLGVFWGENKQSVHLEAAGVGSGPVVFFFFIQAVGIDSC